MTAEEAIEAYMERFGYFPWGLDTIGDEYVVKAVEEALKTGKEWNPPQPPGSVL